MVAAALMRSLPQRRGVLGIATCDKGMPAMMMALASSGALPSVLVPGGVTLLPDDGEDAGRVQTIGARFAQGEITQEYAAEVGCHACASLGGGQGFGTAATSQVVGEALDPRCRTPRWLPPANRSGKRPQRVRRGLFSVSHSLASARATSLLTQPSATR